MEVEKFPKAVIAEPPFGYTQHFRDPKVFSKDGVYYAVIGAQNEQGQGRVIQYRSTDIVNWEFQGEVHTNLDSFGYMWECPDFFQLDGQDILLFSPQGVDPQAYAFNNLYQSGYLLGEVDWKNLKFKPTSDFV